MSGLLTRASTALAIGAGDAGDYMVKDMMKQEAKAADRKSLFVQQMALLSAKLGMEKEAQREQKTWELDEAERRQRSQAANIDALAGQIAGRRLVASPEVEAQADAAARAYNDSLSRGEISQEDANLGYAAAADFRNSNASQDTNIRPEDRTQAAIRLGAISPKDAATLQHNETTTANRLLLENLREDRRDARAQAAEDARDSRLDKRLAGKEELTPAQKMRNNAIDFARKKIAGMTPDEIKRKTSSFTATGRTNPDYDPQLAALVKRAGQTKYGEDLESQLGDTEPAAAGDDIAATFRADPGMKGYSLGKETPNGFEVFDSTGKIVGHYTR